MKKPKRAASKFNAAAEAENILRKAQGGDIESIKKVFELIAGPPQAPDADIERRIARLEKLVKQKRSKK